MSDMPAIGDLVVGSELHGPIIVVTRERMQWYSDALESATEGHFVRSVGTIHTDDEYARAQGLSGIIADGMLSTNWISEMLVGQFGMDYIRQGELRTKFIKPVFEDVVVSVRGQVTSKEQQEDGVVLYALEVWCEDRDGGKLTVGDARVKVAPQVGE